MRLIFRILIICMISLSCSIPLCAQTKAGVTQLAQKAPTESKVADIFASMPDSILPYLTRNNRLDCIDFIRNDMKAVVDNSLGGKSELKELTDDYLSMQLSPTSFIEIKMLPEGSDTIVCLNRTFQLPEPDSHITLYHTDWTEIKNKDILPTSVTRYSGCRQYCFSKDDSSLTVRRQPFFSSDKELKNTVTENTYHWNGTTME